MQTHSICIGFGRNDALSYCQIQLHNTDDSDNDNHDGDVDGIDSKINGWWIYLDNFGSRKYG